VESQASVCFVGGNPVVLRAEPTKQKMRRPERRGITRAVSPKKMWEEENEMSDLSVVGEKVDPQKKKSRCRYEATVGLEDAP
jgi:hypothetical protein